MSTRRSKHSVNITASIHQPSDYESDANYLSDIPPPPLQRTDEQLNLSVLQRHNQEITAIQYVAPYAVVYEFSPDSKQWEKSGIEGTGFVCQLVPTHDYPDRFAVMVLNRRGLENFYLELLSSQDVEVTPEYIILQTSTGQITQVHGLWIFCEPAPASTAHHREAMARTIEDCATRVEHGKHLARDPVGESVPMARELSLKELFGQHRQEDDKALGNGLKPSSPAVSAQSSGQNDALMDLFRKAGEGWSSIREG
jgi:hypothetical protein